MLICCCSDCLYQYHIMYMVANLFSAQYPYHPGKSSSYKKYYVHPKFGDITFLLTYNPPPPVCPSLLNKSSSRNLNTSSWMNPSSRGGTHSTPGSHRLIMWPQQVDPPRHPRWASQNQQWLLNPKVYQGNQVVKDLLPLAV